MTQIAENRRRLAALPEWLQTLRETSRATFTSTGLPTGKEEAWRFTKLQPILRESFADAEPADGAALHGQYSFHDDAAVEIVFVNGHYAPDLSRIDSAPTGLTISTLLDAATGPHAELVKNNLGQVGDPSDHPFALFNTADFTDGAFVHVKRGTAIATPIHFLFISAGAEIAVASHPRVLVIAEKNSEATFVESYVGEGTKYLCNAVSEFVIDDDARIDHCKLQQESTGAFHVANMQVRIGKQTQFVSHSITIGGAITRNDLEVELTGRGGYATLNGLVLIGGTQHCDNHTRLDHAAPDCPSHELYKHVLADKSSAVFKGQIFVNQIAQKTNAKQSSKSLLLSDTAEMNSMPALEIYADDVKCTHGSTIGPIDEDLVFYLRSRGVGIEAARHLLTYAFAADVTRRIRVAPVRRRVEDFMAKQHGLPQDLRINDLGAFDEAVTR